MLLRVLASTAEQKCVYVHVGVSVCVLNSLKSQDNSLSV